MEYFPFYMETTNKQFLMVGGGEMACHKLSVIVQYEAKIHIVAKEICSTLSQYIENNRETCELSQRAYKDKDLDTADYVIVTTKDKGLNHWIAKSCRERRIPVNVAGDKEESSFIMPAIINDGNINIAISSGGRSPSAVSYLKRRIQNQIPDRYGELIAQLGGQRQYIKEKLEDQSLRAEAFECLLSIGLVNDCVLTDEVVKDVVKHLVSEIQ